MMITRFKSAIAALKEKERSRNAMRQLMKLDNNALRDLGIHRADIPRAVLGIDPRF